MNNAMDTSIDILIDRHNPRDIPATETSFYSWLMVSEPYDIRTEAVIDYLDTMYDFDLYDNMIISAYYLNVLFYIYSMWWDNEVRPTL